MPQKNQLPLSLFPLRRALLSVTDKTGLEELAMALTRIGCELFATSSTAAALRDYGLKVSSIEAMTGFPEILGGRVKTLHPKVFGGILSRAGNESDEAELAAHGLQEFDLVVCNLYPFLEAAKQMYDELVDPQKRTSENLFQQQNALIEKMDIGGVTLLRAAAKNCARVSVLCDPADYVCFLQQISAHGNKTSLQQRSVFALKAITETANYDASISSAMGSLLGYASSPEFELALGPIEAGTRFRVGNTLEDNESVFPEVLHLQYRKVQDLRYGENPHQKAAFFEEVETKKESGRCALPQMECFHGKVLSYNNVLDIEHGVRLVSEFGKPAAVILKHNVPCGVAVSESGLSAAYATAFACDTVSPFGGIVCLNRELDIVTARQLFETFLEVIVAPSFSPEASQLLERKKNLRLVKLDTLRPLRNKWQLTCVQGGILIQSYDNTLWADAQLKVVTKQLIMPHIMPAVEFAYSVVKHLRSNAIVVSQGTHTIALAGGYTNRVDAVRTAIARAKEWLHQNENDQAPIVLASDAFFPFPDSVELLSELKVDAIVQPGGSVQDQAVIDAANALNIPMLFTGQRHFKH